jgi:hypothetical protein
MKQFLLLVCIIVYGLELSGQAPGENQEGKISFVSSQNIYVKFTNTEGITAGDTLYISSDNNLIPALKVINLSSVSCLCTSISSANLTVGQMIVARKKIIAHKPLLIEKENVVKETPVLQISADTSKKHPDRAGLKQKINGSISACSYTDLSNTSSANSTRFRYTFSLDAGNIANSRFSAESYISFRYKMGDWGEVKSNLFNALKIYTLAVRYDLNNTTRISLGRRINPRISSIGAMDGLQVEKTLNKFTFGALAGTRPDFTDYGFDSKLFQYGAYLAFNTKTADTYSESSVAIMQQMNRSKTDRRFLYFQHSNSLVKNLHFFSTFEVDLFRLRNDKPQNTFNLTGLFLSLRYKMTRSFTLTGSYDARKNVMYYETYRTFIDSVLINEIRQSFRLQANYRITRDLMFGLESGYRFLKTDPRPSKNISGYLTYYQIPGINISVTLSGTYLESNYLKGKILGASITRDLFSGKLQTGMGYRFVDYRLPENVQNIVQNIGEMNLSWQFQKKMSLSVNYEGTFEKHDKYNRIYFQIRKRF